MRCVVVSVSSADDASSNSQIRPGRNSARAIAIRWLVLQTSHIHVPLSWYLVLPAD